MSRQRTRSEIAEQAVIKAAKALHSRISKACLENLSPDWYAAELQSLFCCVRELERLEGA